MAILMRADGGAGIADIAKTTGLSQGTVRVLHSRFLTEGAAFLADPLKKSEAKDRLGKNKTSRTKTIKPAHPSATGTTVKPTSLRELARIAGVSRTTASLSLRGSLSIGAATRARIQKLADRLGYRPDPTLNQLMEAVRARRKNHRVNTIAYLTAFDTPHGWSDHSTPASYNAGATLRAEKCGYSLVELWLKEPGMTPARLGEIIRNRGITGVLVSPFPSAYPALTDFPWRHFSAVALGYSMAEPSVCRACNHQFQSMQLLVRKLVGRGYRRIGMAMERDHDTRVRHNWLGGFVSARDVLCPEAPLAPLLPASWDRNDFARWLEKCRPDVVISAGLEVRTWLKELGLSTPRDIGYANVDLLSGMDGVTGINQNSRRVGAAGVDLLTSLMRSNERGIPDTPHIVMVEGKFVQGKTTFSQASEE